MRRTAFLLALLAAAPPAARGDEPVSPVKFKKTTVEKKFRAEGVAAADVNKDGKTDILVGDVWYEAPDWKVHPIRKVGDYGDGSGGYSQSFACWADDFNKDGWPDLLVVGFPGAPCHWYENPQNKGDGPWKQHEVWHSACNESPMYTDLLGQGSKVLVMGFQPKGKDNEGQMAYFRPGKDPTATWEMTPISPPSEAGKVVPGTFKFAHGLGAGDVNGDRRKDVIIPNGWWEQPEKATGEPWKWHPAGLGDAAADMYAADIDGDGKADVLSSSAHNYGIWAHIQKPGKDGADPSFLKRDLFPKLVSQTHALHFVDIDGDGLKDLVTGKRRWAHGPKGDADPNADPCLYWFQAKKASDGTITFTPFKIDDASGIGTQFEVSDFNGDGKPDILVANKFGVFLFEQEPAEKK